MNSSRSLKPPDLVSAALAAMPALAVSNAKVRNTVLQRFADQLQANRDELLETNATEVDHARRNGLSASICDRLNLAGNNFAAMIDSIHCVAAQPDPLGDGARQEQDSGISVGRVRVPLGLVCFIYESRPNVTADGAALCIKSGNGVILRSGKEALQTSLAIGQIAQQALEHAGLPAQLVQVIADPDRSEIARLFTDERFDLIIPRGGKQLVEHVQSVAKAPVLAHLYGNCHLYVHSSASQQQALEVILNAKTQRPGTCNAVESLVVDKQIADEFLPELAAQLAAKNVQIVACPSACEILGAACTLAHEQDWQEEYLSLKISIKVVASLEAAVSWINQHSSRHTDGILATDRNASDFFVQHVDSASVLVNTSTRFADGYMYGLGAETGISTGKFHARGPVGLEGLTSYKWVIRSDGAIRH